jgi:hypothetical protein
MQEVRDLHLNRAFERSEFDLAARAGASTFGDRRHRGRGQFTLAGREDSSATKLKRTIVSASARSPKAATGPARSTQNHSAAPISVAASTTAASRP